MRIPLFLALAAAALAFAAACGGGGGNSDERVASVIHRLLLAAGTDDTSQLESFPGELPEGLPVDPPLYPGAELIVSSRQPGPVGQGAPTAEAGTPQPVLYFIVLDTDDSRSDVFTFYEEELDSEPWQLDGTVSTPDLDTIQFTNAEDLDLSGAVSIASGGEDGRTSILISLQDAGAVLEDLPPFESEESLPLPKEFPEDVPLYDGAINTSTAFFREPGNESFLLIFLTRDDKEDVIAFYREELEAAGWTVEDGESIDTELRLTFEDSAGDVFGSVLADTFARDDEYVEVTIQVAVNPDRTPGAGGDETPPPDDEATPEPTEPD